MRLPEEIFEDPRSKSRIDMADQKTLIAEVEELPEGVFLRPPMSFPAW